MTSTVGFVGFGNMNSMMAEFAIKAGYRVVLSNSRGPETLADAVAKLGSLASAATLEDAVQQSDFVSVSVPFANLHQLPVEPFIGKFVIDSTNYYPDELVQRHLKGSIVVKAFHNIDQFHFRFGPSPANNPTRWALPIAGDNSDAKSVVAKFMNAVGFDPVDCGSLSESWRIQQNTPGYCFPYIGELPTNLTPHELFEWVKQDHSRVVKAADVRAMAAKAVTLAASASSIRIFRRNTRCCS